ncbi:ABC transporter ATP-binding protein [Serinibacter arcticus]|uniref:ABC transporter ATP-binding protein n=1 Tax=Serinibacter arcticus TaxID=1655435 RepID=A0A2U1ZTU8_9MICO|nr:ABC transporter ATP-binding protein [Serinibacter arcticus]PWD50409.1 ABC transporter ATP-binding protein [Serinibacter arcticus]
MSATPRPTAAAEPAGAALPVAPGGATARAAWRAARAHRGLLVTSLLTAVVASIGTTATPVLLGRVVDAVAALREDGGAFGSTGLVALFSAIGAAVLVTAVFTGLSLRQVERLGAVVAADLREGCVERAVRMEAGRFERAGAGDVTTRVTEDIELFTLSVPLLAHVVTSLITVVVALAGFVTLDWRLGLAFLVVGPVYALGLRYYLPKAGPLYGAERARSSERSRVLLESIHGRRTVHAYRMAPVQSARVEETSAAALLAGIRAQRLAMRFGLTMNIAEGVGLSGVLACGFLLVRGDLASVGDVTAAALLFHRLFGPLGMLLMSIDQVQRAAAALARIVGIATLPVPPVRAGGATPDAVAVRVRGLRHAYSPGHDVLHDVDLDIPAGTSLAVVGESGAGKTTLAAIVAGVLPPVAGTVELVPVAGAAGGDGAPIAVVGLDPDHLRDVVTMVSQESHVFAGTLRADLLLARPAAQDAQLVEVLERIGAAGWVRALPSGLDTVVGASGHPLTAAQEQHLALVRVALRDAPLVVLDEATAEANSSGSRELERAAARLLRGRTALVVAHRLTQARACDRIAVMHEGVVVELGDHDTLVTAGGLYSRLWAAWSADGAGAR